MANRHMSDSQLYDLVEHLNKDHEFYKKKENEIAYDELNAHLKRDNTNLWEKQTALIDYLISIYIHGKSGDRYFDLFGSYLSGDKERSTAILLDEMSQYGLEKFWVNHSLRTAEYQLHELGFFGDSNKFRNHSLHELITGNAYRGSFNVITLSSFNKSIQKHNN